MTTQENGTGDLVARLRAWATYRETPMPYEAQTVMVEAADAISKLEGMWLAAEEHCAQALRERDALSSRPPQPDMVTEDEIKSLVGDISAICMKHLRPVPGFTFHPCYIDKTAEEPLRTILTTALSAKGKSK